METQKYPTIHARISGTVSNFLESRANTSEPPNATTCVAPDTPTDRDYQLETLRALVSELRGDKNIPFIMMGLPKMNRPWEQYRAVQKQVCDETGAIFVDTFAAGLGDMNDVHPRDKTAFADLAAKAVPK